MLVNSEKIKTVNFIAHNIQRYFNGTISELCEFIHLKKTNKGHEQQ